MPYLLKGRKVLVTGASRGIGMLIASKFASERCNVAINYLASASQANDLATQLHRDHGVKTLTIQGDMANMADCKTVVEKSITELGGLDIIVSNAGNTKIPSKWDDLFALTSEDWDHAFNVFTKCNVFLLQAAFETFNNNPDGGQLLIMNSVGGLSPRGSSLAQSTTRAAGLHLMQCLAATQGPKIRVNAVCPGLVLTERTALLGEEQLKMFEGQASLKKTTDVEDVADAFVFVAKNGSMTGDRVRVDAGLIIR